VGAEHEAAVREFVTAFEGDQWDSAQIDRVLSRMAPDARYHVYAWEVPHVGHDEIRAELLRQAQAVRDWRVEIVTIASIGPTVFTERLDSMTINDKGVNKGVTLHIAGIFEVDSEGKIAVWRDYLDRREVAAELRRGTASGTRD
jgi:limonene-1,2-epoxide hydrolase